MMTEQEILEAIGNDSEVELVELGRRVGWDVAQQGFDFPNTVITMVDNGILSTILRVTTPEGVFEYDSWSDIPEVFPGGYRTMLEDVEYIIRKTQDG